MNLLTELLASRHQELTGDQKKAMNLLLGETNVFLTGGAGTGKSYVLKKFLTGMNTTIFPVLASTGAAAVLIGGRTFHSFFGLGILEGGAAATFNRAVKDRRVNRRIKKATGVVIDEISMIPGEVLAVAEQIAREIRGTPEPWGGLRIIAVGDFAQLPPISRGQNRSGHDWAFLNPVWEECAFGSIELKEVMRSKEDPDFCDRLAEIRQGKVTPETRDFLNFRKLIPGDENYEGSVLFARKIDVEKINLKKLHELEGEVTTFDTEFFGDEKFRKALFQNAPVSDKLVLKQGALVMMRQNDPKGKWVNGSLGHVQEIEKKNLVIRLLNGSWVDVEPSAFAMQDADGNEVAFVKNFPINLAYAVTIHKSQGATLDSATVSLSGLWEPGQAYVALSRVRDSKNLRVQSWDEASIFADPKVLAFNSSLGNC